MTDFDEDLIEELIAESKEHLETIEPDLMGLEENPDEVEPEAINRIFRAVHSIKGGFGFFSLTNIMELAHSMENVMGLIRDGKLAVQPSTVDVLLSGTDKLRVLIDDVQASEELSIEEELAQLALILEGGGSKAPAPAPKEADTSQEAPSAPPGGPQGFVEAMALFNSPGSEPLADEEADRLGVLLKSMCDQVTEGEGKELADDLFSDYEACMGAMGLDGLLREVLAEKLEVLGPFLPGEADTEEAEAVGEPGLGDPQVPSPTPSEEKKPKSKGSKTSTGGGRGSGPSSLRVKVEILDQLMNLAGELVLSRNRIKQVFSDKLAAALTGGTQLRRFEKKLSDSRKQLASLVATSTNGQGKAISRAVEQEFDSIETVFRQFLDSSLADLPGLGGVVQEIDGVTSELQGGIMGTRMQSVGSILSKFPRVIRDMNRNLGKEIVLSIEGQDVELDKSIIESLGDPLTHLIRNSADHGVESPQVRTAAGKTAEGSIQLIARHEGGQVLVEIIDDGAGIDAEKIKGKAVDKGVITPQQAESMSRKEALRLIFAPGFSTAEKVSDVSGRGVGMDVVRSNIEAIGGSVDVDSTVGDGTHITLRLPLTLAIMPALIVRHEERVFALPQVDIEELVRIRTQDTSKRIESVSGNPVMRLREKLLPLISLSEVIGIDRTFTDSDGNRKPDQRERILDRRAEELPVHPPNGNEAEDGAIHDPGQSIGQAESGHGSDREESDRRTRKSDALNVVVLRIGTNRYGLIVNELRDSEEIVVKPLPDFFKSCQFYAGATIMGDGRVAMILDAAGIASSADLRFGGTFEKAESVHTNAFSDSAIAERQQLLLFKNGTSERFSIPLEMVQRIEKIDVASINQVGDKSYLDYKDNSLRLLQLQDFLPIQTPEKLEGKCFVIVPKLVQHPMGIVVRAVEDVLETKVILDQKTVTGTGILGSFVFDGEMIICLDVYGLFEEADPEAYDRVDYAGILKGTRVLLAEDTAFFRSVEGDYLREIGCEVVLAENGEEAWDLLADDQFDILITDVQMPILDGLELTGRVRADDRFAGMPIVALTALVNASDKKRILDAGVDAYETKLDKESLWRTLQRLISA